MEESLRSVVGTQAAILENVRSRVPTQAPSIRSQLAALLQSGALQNE